ncbi:MAG: hypothetical protein AB7G93_21800 [Bdellovibrionales bacterium]
MLAFVILFATSAAWASNQETSDPAQKRQLCRILLNEEGRVDGEAAPLIKGIYNLLAKELRDLERVHEQADFGFDVVEQFNARAGLPGEPISATRLTSISLSSLEGYSLPLNFGVERRAADEALKLERSERIQALGRLSELARAASQVKKKGGKSKLEFAKVYKGLPAIREYVHQMAFGLRHLVTNDSPQVDDSNLSYTSFSFFIGGYRSVPVSETHSRVKFWIFDESQSYERVLPNWLVVPVTSLAGIWIFPGETGVEIGDTFTGLSERVNGVLTYLSGYVEPTQIELSPQVAYSVTAVLGYFVYRLVKALKKRYARLGGATEWMATDVAEIPDYAESSVRAVKAQYFAVTKMLIDVARGTHRVGARNLIHWGTNYRTDEYALAFDLLLFEHNGEPTLVVVNREI